MSEWCPGEVILGEYTIEKELGRGGMGKVWLVKSNSTGRRFAVKQTLIRDEKHRKAFLTELQTWIDLPEHPNIVPCRFFRTAGDDLLIFSEYVEGGSLKKWIDSGRLYEGSQPLVLKQILDIAIQFAWGLHSLHELGLVHQDVKPGNALLSGTTDAALQGLRLQVSDYGLARARARSGAQDAQATGEGSILMSSGGYTPAYCSPEQAKGLPITRKTDLWSWGVSVLEMFTGGVTWHSGHFAGAVLEQYVEDADESSGIPKMPAELVDILRGCFRKNPSKRWANLGEVVAHLKIAYLALTGEDYDRELVHIVYKGTLQVGLADRITAGGGEWEDPRVWLEDALRLSGRNSEEAKDIIERQGRSRRGKLVLELIIFEEAKSIFLDIVKKGRRDLVLDLAFLCRDKAHVHETVDDIPGALNEYDQCIEIVQRLVEQEGHRELANYLLQSQMCKITALVKQGDTAAVVAFRDQILDDINRWRPMEQEGKGGAINDQCVEIRRRLMEEERRGGLSEERARKMEERAFCLADVFSDFKGAVVLYDKSIVIWRRLVEQDGRRDIANNLATALNNKANVLKAMGNMAGALLLYDQCVEIRRRLVEQEGRRELASDWATALANKAFALKKLGDYAGSIKLYDQCIEILRQLVEKESRRELAKNMVTVLEKKAYTMSEWGVALFAQHRIKEALELFMWVTEIRPNSPLALNNVGMALASMGRADEAVMYCKRALEADSACRNTWDTLGFAHLKAGRYEAAISALLKAIELEPKFPEAWRHLLHAYDRAGQAEKLARAKKQVGEILPDELARYEREKGTDIWN